MHLRPAARAVSSFTALSLLVTSLPCASNAGGGAAPLSAPPSTASPPPVRGNAAGIDVGATLRAFGGATPASGAATPSAAVEMSRADYEACQTTD